jgi:sugar (pentulose or hexulose) kinase
MEAIQGHAASVRAIGVSGQQHGLVVLDANKEVIRPAKLWNDTETNPPLWLLLASATRPLHERMRARTTPYNFSEFIYEQSFRALCTAVDA